ncbi:MAG: cell wall-binding repeat-containing protein [Erysipelotrichaceae bacterium]|nr:cell wall-binding repeat-containing protein [Erysipelotrichaceae bacterium]
MKKIICMLICILLMCGILPHSFIHAEESYVRLSGTDRYDTSVKTAEELRKIMDISSFDAVILATGEDFADALSGGYLAAVRKAPILLTKPSKASFVNGYIRDHLKDNGVIYVLGGEKAVPSECLEGLDSFEIIRLSGKTRYDTNLKILEEAGVSSEEILICSGENYADCLSASGTGKPILLVKDTLKDQQKTFLEEHSENSLFILGGTAAISESLEEEIKGYSEIQRLSGKTRYETSVLSASAFYDHPEQAVLVYGENFPDGLSAGPLAFILKAPVLLTKTGKEEDTGIYTKNNCTGKGYVLGGTGLISDEAAKEIFTLPYSCSINMPKEENNQKVYDYAERLYNENQYEDYFRACFTWSREKHKRGWLYYNGLMLESYMMLDGEKYASWIKDFCDQHITAEGKVRAYVEGELDSAMPAVLLVDLVDGEFVPEEEAEGYRKAINFVYNSLERQTAYPEAGNLYQHGERNGVPVESWSKWNIALDGIYMSQLFLIRLCSLIDEGKITITSNDGHTVTSEEIWKDIYTRMAFVLEHMRHEDTGLIDHAYSIELARTNGIVWGRGMGWFVMVLLEAAEKTPDKAQKEYLSNGLADVMNALIEWRDPDSCLWYNVVDRREDIDKNRIETSGSAMFAYVFLRGYHNGILKDQKYHEAGLCAFNSLTETMMTEEGLTGTLIGMGPREKPEQYQGHPFVTNEAKGVGPFFMALRYAY